MKIEIKGARVLLDEVEERTIAIDGGLIAPLGASPRTAGLTLHAEGCLVLPGIVDCHGDAFERQMMPRPGVNVALDVALADSDRQAVANGITTVFHGVTWSWEPGLRGSENARGILAGIETMKPKLSADTRYHLRHETFNLDAEPEVLDWVAARRVGAVAFNDHLPSSDSLAKRPDKISQMVERAGIPREDFLALVQRLHARREEVPVSISRMGWFMSCLLSCPARPDG